MYIREMVTTERRIVAFTCNWPRHSGVIALLQFWRWHARDGVGWRTGECLVHGGANRLRWRVGTNRSRRRFRAVRIVRSGGSGRRDPSTYRSIHDMYTIVNNSADKDKTTRPAYRLHYISNNADLEKLYMNSKKETLVTQIRLFYCVSPSILYKFT